MKAYALNLAGEFAMVLFARCLINLQYFVRVDLNLNKERIYLIAQILEIAANRPLFKH